MAEITVQGIAELLKMEAVEDQRSFTDVAGFDDAGPGSIVFAEDEAALQLAKESGAGLILVPERLADGTDSRLFATKHPKYAFAAIGRELKGYEDGMIHPTAAIDRLATLGKGTSIGAYTVIGAGTEIGDRCLIGDRVTIHAQVRLGDECVVQVGGGAGVGWVWVCEGAGWAICAVSAAGVLVDRRSGGDWGELHDRPGSAG